jgi:hypothetical protein
MKQFNNTTVKSFLIALALTAVPLTALARDSLEALRTDLNTTNTTVTSLQTQVNALTPDSYAIGDTGPGGGIVFFVSDDGKHGLEAAPGDQSTGIQWFNGSFILTGAVWNGINGERNTDRIITSQGHGSYAALLCANYTGGGYGDWYLPSKYELNLLYQQKAVVGGFATSGNYWSSTEDGSYYAWFQNFYHGDQNAWDKANTFRVRAVRAF